MAMEIAARPSAAKLSAVLRHGALVESRKCRRSAHRRPGRRPSRYRDVRFVLLCVTTTDWYDGCFLRADAAAAAHQPGSPM